MSDQLQSIGGVEVLVGAADGSPVGATTVLDLVGDALRSDAARDRGLFRSDVVEAMLAAPNEHRTNLDGSTLWQLGLLELWLQTHVDR